MTCLRPLLRSVNSATITFILVVMEDDYAVHKFFVKPNATSSNAAATNDSAFVDDNEMESDTNVSSEEDSDLETDSETDSDYDYSETESNDDDE